MSPVPEGAVHYMDLRKYVKLFLKKIPTIFPVRDSRKNIPHVSFSCKGKKPTGTAR
jgi:hypothetical protein